MGLYMCTCGYYHVVDAVTRHFLFTINYLEDFSDSETLLSLVLPLCVLRVQVIRVLGTHV